MGGLRRWWGWWREFFVSFFNFFFPLLSLGGLLVSYVSHLHFKLILSSPNPPFILAG